MYPPLRGGGGKGILEEFDRQVIVLEESLFYLVSESAPSPVRALYNCYTER